MRQNIFKFRQTALSVILIWRDIRQLTYRAPFQYKIRDVVVKSREDSKPLDLYLDLSNHSEIWQAALLPMCLANFYSDAITQISNPAASRLHGFLRYDVWLRVRLVETNDTR